MTNVYLFYVSFASLGLGLGLEESGLGLALALLVLTTIMQQDNVQYIIPEVQNIN